jgi:DNA-directed RNA polymerase specialized sigma24 family protein
MKVKYAFATKDTVEIEVDEKTFAELKELDRLEYNSNKKETRRHCSADAHYEKFGFEIAGETDFVEMLLSKELWHRLLKPLNAKQRELIYKRFVEKQKYSAIAKDENISPSAIQNRFERIFARIKKFVNLTDFGGGK